MQLIKFIDKVYNFQLPKKILFGVGVSGKVGFEAKALGGEEVLLVTDQVLSRMSNLEG